MSVAARRARGGLLFALALWTGAPDALHAQVAPPEEPAAAAVFDGSDWALAGGLIAAQVALFAFDDDLLRLAGRMQGETADDLSDAFRPIGRRPPLYWAAGAAFALGTLARERRVADAGLHAFLSIVLANAVTGSLKMVSGRARPWVPVVQGGDTTWVASDPHEWEALAGLSEGGPRQSWPSGHATTAFALATVLAEELGGVTPWIAYPIATGVAWSRVHEQAHWATDVVMGALVGIFSARLVVRHGHREGSWLERTLLLDADPARREVSISVPWSW